MAKSVRLSKWHFISPDAEVRGYGLRKVRSFYGAENGVCELTKIYLRSDDSVKIIIKKVVFITDMDQICHEYYKGNSKDGKTFEKCHDFKYDDVKTMINTILPSHCDIRRGKKVWSAYIDSYEDALKLKEI
jgi:hypothetical protein